MRKATALALLFGGAMLAIAAPAGAQFVGGGHDETSEANAAFWAVGPLSPAVGPAPGASLHLILSEVAVTPTSVEFIEIHNPTGAMVDLSNYYLSDAWFEAPAVDPSGYHNLPSGTLVVGTPTDFVVRFPAGAMLAAGGTMVIALYGAGVDSAFGPGVASYEVTPSSPGIPDMINVGGNVLLPGGATLTNGSEFVVLFYWDQVSDLVCDEDYVTWGPATTTSRVDKTGFGQDGPDGDALVSLYLADTPDASQSSVTAPGSGSSVARLSGAEGAESSPGNGCLPGGPTPTRRSTWGQLKVRYR